MMRINGIVPRIQRFVMKHLMHLTFFVIFMYRNKSKYSCKNKQNVPKYNIFSIFWNSIHVVTQMHALTSYNGRCKAVGNTIAEVNLRTQE